MDIIDESGAVIQPLERSWYFGRIAQLDMLRLDLLHPHISGNKWFKLKHNLQAALTRNAPAVLSFGGPHSNHLAATAAAASQFNLTSIGVVRGVYKERSLTPTLKFCLEMGMQLEFVSRRSYARREEQEYLDYLSDKFDHPFIIPEGGANKRGREGAAEIASLIPADYTHIAVSVGTGTTLIGLRSVLPLHQRLLGFVPMKGGSYLQDDMQRLLPAFSRENWTLFDKWHFGGFGKWNAALVCFMNEFYSFHHIPLDIVYTAKMMAGVKQLIEDGYFPEEARLLCIHTGGLQGNASIENKLAYRQ